MSDSDSGYASEPLGPGYIRDYISRKPVRATPEEKDAVQVFARRLVDDYGYPRSNIRTRPQFTIRRSPSNPGRPYPVDIAVFTTAQHSNDSLAIVVECKKKTRQDGIEQLHRYLEMSNAQVGVWFNGIDHVYLRKIVGSDGTLTYAALPNIPRHGERLADIGKHRRNQLTPPDNLKSVFIDLRNHLAGNALGITRDEQLAQEIINILFCKIYDEIHTPFDDLVTFRCGVDEVEDDVQKRIVDLFERVKAEYGDVFDDSDQITLDRASIFYVVGELQNYLVTRANRDAVAEAFEVFIGPALRGSEGQFFTPRNVVNMTVKMLDPQPEELIIDPACGSGGFLISALENVWRHVDQQGEERGWDPVQVDRRKREVATRFFRGIDKDSFLAKVTKAYMAIIGDGRGGVFCENSLLPPSSWDTLAQRAAGLGQFDVVLTNPPFGKKIKISDNSVLGQYTLAKKWKRDSGDLFTETSVAHDSRPPQILFLERCLQFLKPGGRLGIVLPESLFGMPSHSYVVNFLMTRATVRAVVAMPEPLFKTSGKGGTHAKVCVVFVENRPPDPGEQHDIFMADAEWCGHDSRGNQTIRQLPDGGQEFLDNVPLIAERFLQTYGTSRAFWTQ